jgi:septal ring-binding cell division protein DamX
MPEASRAAPLAGVFPPRLVARLHRESFEGTLRVQAQGVTRVLYFRRGDIASAASNADDDRLHNILIREGRLTGPQVDMARARQRPGVSLGKTLIELGFLTPSELLQGARRQVRQILSAVFALSDGSFEIVPGPLPPEVTVLGLPARRLIFDAVLETGDRQTVVREMGSMESVYRTTPLFRDSLPALRLEAAHGDVAANVDGTATLRDLSGRTRLDDLTVSKIVLALEILGLVEPVASEPRPAAPTSRRILVESAEEPQPKDPVPIRLAFEPPPPTAPEPASPPEPAMPAEAKEAEQPDETHEELELEDEPPPPGELPAFAAPYAAPVGWQVDPETGERSHPGPVEMTFDGPVIPPPPRRQTGGRTVAAAGVFLVIILGAYAAVRLNRQPSPQKERAETRTASISAKPSAEEAPPEPPESSPKTAPAAEPSAVDPPTTAPAASAAVPEESTTAPQAGPDLTPGERLLDAGAVDRAADAFARMLASLPAETLTLQMMIACEAETVHKARLGTRPATGLFVTATTVRDRSCYRVLWGLYGTRAEAESAAESPPAYFTAAGIRPTVVSLGRIRRPA